MKYFLLLNLCLLLDVCAFSQDNKGPVSSSVAGHIFKPEKVDVKDEYVKALKVPQGFKIEKFAEDLGKPRMMAVSDHGYVYVSRRNEGDVMLLKDENDDDIADLQKVVAKIEHADGLTINNGKLYIAAINKVYEADINEDGTLSQPKIILDDLPDGGQHANRTIDFGPDGLMYITVGSMCNACDEANPESAAILQVGRDFKNRNVYTSGLRNTIGFDWHPETGELYGMDHGIDWLGD